MALPNIFSIEITDQVIKRIEQLTPDSQPEWGKMNVAQMLAHCCVAYELVYDNKHPKPGAFMKFLISMLAKNQVVSEKPYPKSIRTAPQFLITDEKEFHTEKSRLIAYLERTQKNGKHSFQDKESHSFGKLSAEQWNNLFYKHVDHHLKQFGA